MHGHIASPLFKLLPTAAVFVLKLLLLLAGFPILELSPSALLPLFGIIGSVRLSTLVGLAICGWLTKEHVSKAVDDHEALKHVHGIVDNLN